MKNDISAIGNALVDTVFKVEHSLISELGLEIDQMTLSSAEEHAPIIDRLIASGADTVSDCVDLQQIVLLQQQALVPNASTPAKYLMIKME